MLGCYGVRRFVRQEEKRTLILSTRGPPQSRSKSSSCRDAPRSTHCHPTGAMAQPWALTRGRRRESLRHAVSDWRSECYLNLFTAVRSKSYTQEVTSRTDACDRRGIPARISQEACSAQAPSPAARVPRDKMTNSKPISGVLST